MTASLPRSSASSTGSPTASRVDRSHIALAFVLAHPAGVIPIIGTQDPARIVASKQALDVQLDRADVYAIVQASEGAPLP